MSTAIAEPPPTEVVKPVEAAPVMETKAPEAVAAAEQDALVQTLLRPTVAKIGEVKPPAQAKKEEVKKEEPRAKVETDADRNFAALREKADAAEKRAIEHEARIKAITEEYETFKKQPVPKEFEERLTKAEQERANFQKELQAAALARDPDFQQKYAVPIDGAIKRMSAAFVAAGADQKEVNAAIAQWNEGQFNDWMESMPATQKLQAQAAYMRAVELDTQRSAELANADQGWQELQKGRAAEQERATKQYMDGLRAEKKSIIEELMTTQPIFKDDPALQKEVETLIDETAGLNGTRRNPRQILESVAKSQVLARHFQRVDKERGEALAKVTELEAKLKERDDFIAAQSNSSPTINPTGAKATQADTDAAVNALLHPKVRV